MSGSANSGASSLSYSAFGGKRKTRKMRKLLSKMKKLKKELKKEEKICKNKTRKSN